ncbi:hypothetical protein CJF32_00007197 [Rutstroemia sp. NJR-2017a WRK4]|nr:hypothetical protein CJF32_00007197 [Rutstroemia sp. NJR-2017a WRK4]
MAPHSSKSKKHSNHQDANMRDPSSSSSATSQQRRRVYQQTQTPLPETGPISQEQLVAQVKTISAGLIVVEKKCDEVDKQMGSAALHEPNQHWQADVQVIDGPIIEDPAALFDFSNSTSGDKICDARKNVATRNPWVFGNLTTSPAGLT